MLYRIYEMILWLLFLIIGIPYTLIIFIPYVLTGKDYIGYQVKLYNKCLFKKTDDIIK